MNGFIYTWAGRQRAITRVSKYSVAGANILSVTDMHGNELGESIVQPMYTADDIATGKITWMPFSGPTVPLHATGFCVVIAEGPHSGYVNMEMSPAAPMVAEYLAALRMPLSDAFKALPHA